MGGLCGMKNIISYFIKYPVVGNILIFLIMALGYMGLKQLNSTLVPQVKTGMIQIMAKYPGASPQEIEEGIVLKIENELKGTTGIYNIKSTSKENVGLVTVVAMSGYDEDLLLQDVKNVVDQISSFPAGMERPSISKLERISPAIFFCVKGDLGLREIKKYARQIESDLRSVNGISKIELSGFPEEEIEIGFREDDLKTYGLTFSEACEAVKSANIDLTGGNIKGDQEELYIRTKQKKFYAKELEDIVLISSPNGIVRLYDVADIKDKWVEEPVKNEVDGQKSVIIRVNHTEREDIVNISENVRKYITGFNKKHEVVKAEILYDLSDEISVMKKILIDNGIVGFFLVIFFLSLFLNKRLSFWVAMGIPLSFMGMFMLSGLFGITINKISLFGMIVVVGILVDDAIVICENIYQHYEKGKSPIQAAVDGTYEAIPAVFSAVLTTIVAFATFFFIDGVMGQFFVDMTFVVIAALVFSFIECIFILPSHVAHSKALSKGEKKAKIEEKVNNYIILFRNKYFAKGLHNAINNKSLTVSLFLAFLLITIGAFKGGIIKMGDASLRSEDFVDVKLKMPAGTPENDTYRYLREISKYIRDVGEDFDNNRTDGLSTVSSIEIEQTSSNEGLVRTYLLGSEERGFHSNVFSESVRKKVGDIPEAEKLEFVQKSQFGKPVSVSLLSYDLNDLNEAKLDLKNRLRELNGLANVIDNDETGMREVKITLKDKAYLLGLTLKEVMTHVRNGFFGAEVQRINRGQDLVKVWVRYCKNDRSDIGHLEEMRIRTKDGNSYPLKEIANMEYERNLTAINHFNGKREITIEADVANSDANIKEIKEELEFVIIPEIMSKYPNISFHYGGHDEESKKVGDSMKKVAPIILLLLIAIVGFTFRSILQSLLIFALLPFGFIGIGWGHYLHGYPVDMVSYLGIIALLGVMVNDSIVLIAAVNELLKKGHDFYYAVYHGTMSRFRPIVMTSLTTIAGLYPIIFSGNAQSQMVIPMAISVAYGLLIATIITLFFLPVMLIIINDIKRYYKYIVTGIKPSAEEVEMAVREKLVMEKDLNESIYEIEQAPVEIF